jgi:hypothetical protein
MIFLFKKTVKEVNTEKTKWPNVTKTWSHIAIGMTKIVLRKYPSSLETVEWVSKVDRLIAFILKLHPSHV